MKKWALLLALCTFSAGTASAGDLVRVVRNKLSAGDTQSGASALEAWKWKHGVDEEYLDGLGWLARGAEMLRRPELAEACVAELRKVIPEEKPETLIPYGAAIEVEARLKAAALGRGAALGYLESEFARAHAYSLRCRIRKNINLLSLEGASPMEPLQGDSFGPPPPSLASLKGKPALLVFWVHGCGDCIAQAPALAHVVKKYESRGLTVLAPTRYLGSTDSDSVATPATEKAYMRKVWAETFKGLESVPVVIDSTAMLDYGVSATPTFALVDRAGKVRLYTPTRLSEAELSKRIEEVLAEAP